MKGLDALIMAGPAKPKKPGASAADDAAKEFVANPSAATFKALMDLCEMEEEEGGYEGGE
jgi:hypothetical protein